MGKFEQEWKDGFEGAEFSPSDSLWANIDRDLSTAEAVTMKRRIVFYQRIAAAAVMFALLVGTFGIFRWQQGNDQVAQGRVSDDKQQENEKKVTEKENPALIAPGEIKDVIDGKESNGLMASSKSNAEANKYKSKLQAGDRPATKKEVINLNAESAVQSPHQLIASAPVKGNHPDEKFFGGYGAVGGPEPLPIPEIHDGPIQAEIMRKLPAISGAFLARKEKKKVHEQAWASVTAAAGSYNPNTNNSYASYNYNSVSQSALPSSASSPAGSSYSFGMLAGMRVAKRVVVQSGVQYVNQSIGSVSNINSSGSLDAVAQFAANSPSANYNTTSPYNINSANEFVSVPIQAGYLFIDRKVGLQLNSGVSTDFFIRNTLSDPSGQRQSYSQPAGQESPYRSVNFSGLLSSEVSYKLGNRYRVSVVPGFHYSFNPVLKSASGSSGNPVMWDVAFRFRYIIIK